MSIVASDHANRLFRQLPRHLKSKIASTLPIRDKCSLRLVNKAYNNAVGALPIQFHFALLQFNTDEIIFGYSTLEQKQTRKFFFKMMDGNRFEKILMLMEKAGAMRNTTTREIINGNIWNAVAEEVCKVLRLRNATFNVLNLSFGPRRIRQSGEEWVEPGKNSWPQVYNCLERIVIRTGYRNPACLKATELHIQMTDFLEDFTPFLMLLNLSVLKICKITKKTTNAINIHENNTNYSFFERLPIAMWNSIKPVMLQAEEFRITAYVIPSKFDHVKHMNQFYGCIEETTVKEMCNFVKRKIKSTRHCDFTIHNANIDFSQLVPRLERDVKAGKWNFDLPMFVFAIDYETVYFYHGNVDQKIRELARANVILKTEDFQKWKDEIRPRLL